MIDQTTALSDTDLAQLETLFRAAATLAESRIVEIAGRPFLADLLADPAGEVVVQVAVKGQLARVLVRWPHHGAGLVTIADLVPGTSGRLASCRSIRSRGTIDRSYGLILVTVGLRRAGTSGTLVRDKGRPATPPSSETLYGTEHNLARAAPALPEPLRDADGRRRQDKPRSLGKSGPSMVLGPRGAARAGNTPRSTPQQTQSAHGRMR